MTRFAGQAADITQFMPKDGPQYDKLSNVVLDADNGRRIGGINSTRDQSIAGVNSIATAQLGNLKGDMMISQGELNAAKIKYGAEANAAAIEAQGDAAQFGGMMSGLSGLATGGLRFAKNKGWFDKGGNMGGSNYWDPKTGKGVAGPNFGL